MARGPIALIAVAIAAALLVAGCGGSDDSSGSASSISKEEFVAKADAICTKGNKRMEAQLAKFLTDEKKITKPTQKDNEEFVTTVLIPNLKQEVKEFKALGVPEGDDERVDAMIVALEEGLETAEDNPQAVAAGTTDVVFGIVSRLAGEYGAEVCGSR